MGSGVVSHGTRGAGAVGGVGVTGVVWVSVAAVHSPSLNGVERCWFELKARVLPRRWSADVEASRAGVEAG